MAKVDYRKLRRKERLALYEEFFGILQVLKRHKDRRIFLMDLLTESELMMFARRIQIARRLLAGFSYYRIRRELKVGFDTIQTVHEWLDTKFADYRAVIPALYEERQKGKLSPLQLEKELMRAYSPNYLLFKLLFGYHVAERHLARQYTSAR